MCDIFGTKAAAAAANQQTAMMEQQQAQHDAAVAQGKSSIDQAFSQFTPDYFNNYKQTYLNAYNPQLDDQYGLAKDSLTAGLADRGVLESSTGGNAFGQLSKTYNNAQADIGNAATDASNALRANVNNTKNNLYSLNAQAADPLTMASQAQEAGAAVAAPTAFPSLGNIFGSALQPFTAAAYSNSTGMNPGAFGPVAPPYSQAPGAGAPSTPSVTIQ